uniref:Uncharacterized protein n=1 Tax=Myoviridae sp. ctZDd15 TaxID=2826664 RepID=A0A8S5M0Y1_9CAUD|nr:MAG TPA: hypothetical protein [Myoviridae sp. ctZDd15]
MNFIPGYTEGRGSKLPISIASSPGLIAFCVTTLWGDLFRRLMRMNGVWPAAL